MVAHLLWEQGAAGSNPASPTGRPQKQAEWQDTCLYPSDVRRVLCTKVDLESARVAGNVDLSGYVTNDALTRSLGEQVEAEEASAVKAQVSPLGRATPFRLARSSFRKEA